MKNILLFFLLFPQLLFAQDPQPLDIFKPLVGRTWQAEAAWSDSSEFKQTITFKYALGDKIVIAETMGFLNQEKTAFGHRNHGIRWFNIETNEVEFEEYDSYGNVTRGRVVHDGQNILYQYEYGELYLTDMWEYVDPDHYNFKVGIYQNGEWEKIYVNTGFKAVSIMDQYNRLRNQLKGQWVSEAWSGNLHEAWSVDENGHIVQKATYKVAGEILYTASNKIELVNGELILFSVIKDSTPKIFKATTFTADEVIFENPDYSNPSKVHYKFIDHETFHRTISGVEKRKPTTYTFKFSRE